MGFFFFIQWGGYTSTAIFGQYTFTYPISFTELYAVTGGFSGVNNWSHLSMYNEHVVTSRLEQVLVGGTHTSDASGSAYAAYYIAVGI